ncbi:DUF3604 domain-containing protein [Pseudosulfitobacter sp. DSM 107133]|uniref:DUF3604 domain-containing protein n=1 Tax=Pseudosulfitobacter sp. DSM 107133 TaxID=2883100 RepID=UPI0013B4196E|nr:DUF3604 domain-containing protein [Pseudosulfitobacter sp. DSM 107133]
MTLTYTAGHFGIDDLGGIKISIRSASDQTPPQFDDPAAAGYTTITASNGARLKYWYRKNSNIRPWGNTLYIQCLNYLSEGDTITVRMGDMSQGSPGMRMQTFVEHAYEFRVHVDAFSTYDYTVLPDDRQPKIRLIPGPSAVHQAVLPSLRAVGDSFALGFKAEDRWGNPTPEDTGTYTLHPTRPVEGLPETVSMKDSNGGALLIEGLSVESPGDLSVEIRDNEGKTVATTNTLRIAEAPDFRHFWSDMHGQSGETIGTNTARQYFEFGRDKAFLDICGHQGNDFQITDTFWQDLNELTAELNDPGRYVTVPGYEWSGNTSVGGDHNVWYRTEGRPIYRAQRSLVMEDSTDENTCIDAAELFDRLNDEDALVVAHVGGRYADVSYAHDANLEPSVEVHSAWGTFDWIFEDAYKAGYRVGIVSASDGHKGRIGASYPGSGKFGSLGGLTCHLMPSLDRNDLFEAFRHRRHYATTGCRPFIDVRIAGLQNGTRRHYSGEWAATDTALIGDIVTCENTEIALDIDISAHAGIERIEIKDGLSVLTHIQTEAEARRSGNRIRVQCEGAEYRGRSRRVDWDVVLTLDSTPRSTRAVNFWNADCNVEVEGNTVSWGYVTTGGAHAVDIWMEDGFSGTLNFNSNVTGFAIDLAELGTKDIVHDCGGLGKAVRLSRLPDEMLPSKLQTQLSVPLSSDEERCLFARIVFEDGHIAWTSPIYITRTSQ